MRRFSPLLFILVLALLLPSAALAKARSGAPAAAPHAQALVLPSVLATAGRATCNISGTVLNFDGSPMVNAEVDWAYDNAGSLTYGGFSTTNAAGQFTMSNVLVTATGTLDVFPSTTNDFYRQNTLNFVEGAAFVIRPGHITFTTDHAAPGTPWSSVTFETYGPGGIASTSFTAVSGDVPAVATSVVDHAVAYWFINEGKEVTLPAPIAVTAGALSTAGVTVSEADAQFISVMSPAWASGAPGTRITVEVENWLAPMTASFSFASENPNDTHGSYPWSVPFVGSTAASRVVTMTIPKQVKPGFGVRVHMAGTDGSTSLLDLYDRFQVCTLAATKASIAKGASVRLSGIVPTGGSAKKVVLYSRTTKTTAQPASWKSPAGWKKVATLSASKAGAYKSGLLKPTKTTWYIVRYPGDSSDFEAFTSVLKVAVH